MKKIALVVLVLCVRVCFGQTTFQKGYFEKGLLRHVQPTSDSGYIATGYTMYALSMILLKTDANGDTLWTRELTDSLHELWSFDISQTTDAGYVICGAVDAGTSYSDILLIRTNSNGDTLWTKIFNGGGFEDGDAVEETNDGGFIIIGSSNQAVYLLKTNSTGDMLWSKSYAGNAFAYGRSITITNDNGFVIGGNADGNFLLIRTDSIGDTLWVKSYDVQSGPIVYSMKQTSDNGFILIGTDGSGICMVKTDSVGDLVWSKLYGCHNPSYISIDETSNGEYVLAGCRETTQGVIYGFLTKIDSAGDTLGRKNYGTTGLTFVRETHDGGFISGGSVDGLPWYYGGLIKTDANGNTGCGEIDDNWIITTPPTQAGVPSMTISSTQTIVGTPPIQVSSGTVTTIPCSSVGLQPQTSNSQSEISFFPNPTTGKLIIDPDSYRDEELKIKSIGIYNLLGKKVGNWQYAVGKKEITIDVSDLAPGIYILQATAGEKVWRGKVVKE